MLNYIYSSGGALVAINVALERPDLVDRVIADSFEGEYPLEELVQSLKEQREASKQQAGVKMFYYMMHGEDWESIVDNDTTAILEHYRTLGKFFHKPLSKLRAKLLLTGSNEDEFVKEVDPDFYMKIYSEIIRKVGFGEIHIFKQGGHPALISNKDKFVTLVKAFLSKK